LQQGYRRKGVNLKDSKQKSSDDSWILTVSAGIIVSIICIGGAVGYFLAPILIEKVSKKTLYITLGIILSIGVISFVPYAFDLKMDPNHLRASIVCGFWFVGAFAAILFQSVRAKVFDNSQIKSADIEKHRKMFFEPNEFEVLIKHFKDPTLIPIGLSFPQKEPVFLNDKLLLEHMVVSGATGQGKTTALIVQVMHSLFHRKPVIIIDPKGDMCDLELIMDIARKLGRSDAVKLFSLAQKNTSLSYNALEVGTAQQKVSKLITACDLANADNPYYGNIATNALTSVIEAFHYLDNYDFTFDMLLAVLRCESELQDMLDLLKEHDSDPLATKLHGNLKRISFIDSKDLAGLRGALQTFVAVEFANILGDPDPTERGSIDLLDVLNNAGVAYFQLNINGYSSMSKRLGKLILEDLKLISNRIQARETAKGFDTAAVLIDEFGVFAQPDFISFLKMSRTAGISLRMFFQNLADLKDVSENFESQTLGNSVYKLIFRSPDHAGANTIAETAGTIITKEESYQVEHSVFGSVRTGLGNQKETYQFKLHPNDIKKLARGQGILIDANSSTTTLFQTWDAKNPQFLNSIGQSDLLQKEVKPAPETKVIQSLRYYPFNPEYYFVDYKGFTYALSKDEFEIFEQYQLKHSN
jgi:hypothetical protein